MGAIISIAMLACEGVAGYLSGGFSGVITWAVMMLASMLFNRCVGGGVAVTGFAAVAWWGLSKLLGVSNEKMMKAPGKDYYIPRRDFERNPTDWFRNHRSK
ncbi:hypothetical protein OROHE_008117 [Orobanche hederae]